MEYDFENMQQKSMPKQVKEIAKIVDFDYFDGLALLARNKRETRFCFWRLSQIMLIV